MRLENIYIFFFYFSPAQLSTQINILKWKKLRRDMRPRPLAPTKLHCLSGSNMVLHPERPESYMHDHENVKSYSRKMELVY